MRIRQCVQCKEFPCHDVKHESYLVPDIDVKVDSITAVMVSESSPENAGDYYYAKGEPFFAQTTVQCFREAGVGVSSVKDILKRGVYLTTAVKCSKIRYGLQTETIRACSVLLEQELALFPKARVLLLMGDVAIQALNCIARRAGENRVIPAGSTYKLRGGEYFFRGMRVFPSYLQAGPSFFIERGKHKVIAEDIAAAMRLIA